jgi:TonB family protein
MNTAVIRSDWIGRVIDGRFTLLQWLGGSGSSDVFLTEVQGDSPQKAAIKLIPADTREAEVHVAHWALTTRLSHPHLARVLYTGRFYFDTAPFNYLVTEFAEQALSQILPERPLTPDETREMLDPVLDALFYLHKRGFVHGHVKPSNILVIDDQLKLSADSLHVAGEFDEHFATPGVYDAPELARAAISPAADVWSLGITLVEALTQRPPVADGSTNRGPVVLESIPQPFAGIAQECLRRDPGRRCTLSDIRARLDKPVRKQADRVVLDEMPPDRTLSNRASEPPETLLARFRTEAIVAAAVLILLMIAAVLLLRSRHVEPSPTAENQPAPAQQSPAPETPAPAAGTPAHTGGLVKGEVLNQVLPDVPAKASRTIHGQVGVIVRVAVDSRGDVSKVTLDSAGPSRYFANLAERAAHRWKFKPAQMGGEAVPSVWIIRFGFRESGTDVNSVEVTH